ncbi:MAG: hypothetical protein J2O48_04615 [Solirubrobacterales bacterium]|nr:hypothetical protein [Solirubrobacterales bacterium]
MGPERRLGFTAAAALLALIAALCISGCGAGQATAQGRTTLKKLSLSSGGRQRSYLLQVPANHKRAMPLVIVLHGADETARSTLNRTDFAAVARQRGWLLAVPQGYANTWNAGTGGTAAATAGVDDVSFIASMVARIRSSYPVDSKRIAAAGFSNGALLAQLLGCRLANTLTAIAAFEGPLPVGTSAHCAPARPLDVLGVHGTADASIPYKGGTFVGVGGRPVTVLSAPASTARWATMDRCGTRPQARKLGTRQTTTYAGCRGGARVELVTVPGGTHDWAPDSAQLVAGALPGGSAITKK